LAAVTLMNRLAIFVEGQTEQVFAERFLLEVFGRKGLHVEKRKAVGGKKGKRRLVLLSGSGGSVKFDYYALIIDCSADSRVKSDIMEQYAGLVASGYQAIIGIRDAYPEVTNLGEIPKLRKGLEHRVKTKPIKVTFVLAIMEIEAWFIAEYTHFTKISKAITIGDVKATLGFDPTKGNLEFRAFPSEDLNKIYQLGGRAYNKTVKTVSRTVNSLDFARIYLELVRKNNDLKVLALAFDRFLSASKGS